MATSAIDFADFTCSICREIFENPVTLLCSHSYCQSCLNGLKNSPSSSLSDLALTPPSPPPSGSLIYRPKSHETDQCFTCAICRKVSLGYTDCRDIDIDLKTLEGPCSHCSKSFLLCDLRKHTEKCVEARRILNPENMRKIFDKNFVKQLSTPQVQALEKARTGENRSTFSCPYCHRANFSVQHLCRHIEKHHLDDDPQQVCPICASMPWGDKHRLSRNIYEHLVDRHRFDYGTYVNYDQDEDTMIAEAVERSLIYQ